MLIEKIKKIFKKFFRFSGVAALLLIPLFLGLLIYFNLPVDIRNENAELGVTFSARYARDIGLDWRENYSAILDELGAKKIRIPVYWDLVEPEPRRYDFSDLDWQISEGAKRDAEIILTIGQKVPRWPECHIPQWAKGDDELKKQALLEIISRTVERYRDESAVKYWQIENEPFLPFGICPSLDVDLLDREIALVRSLDPSRRIIITDSGELSLWVRAAKRADVFGTTMYRTIFNEKIGYFDYPIGPRFFHFKYFLIRVLAGQDRAIVIELQGEPWISGWTTSRPLEEQFNSMNAEKLMDNIDFAKKAGFPEIYLWGAEWWWWLKTQKNEPSLWDAAKISFRRNES